ncbi:MAG: EAL domain-containing protein [Acidobacteriota bacterium]
MELATGRRVGVEALVRWQRSGRVVGPDSFIAIAEESGVITQITACVIEIVAADLPVLLKADPNFIVAINLSVTDLCSTQTAELFVSLLKRNGIKLANIKVEATARGFLQDAKARVILAAIRELGVEVAIDDFGTGYSSLACLETLSLDALKIDKAFVDTIGTDGATSHVASHIISMAHSLDLIMVAEGVETEAQLEFLRRNGVEFAQGWLFGKPMSLSSLRVECKN